MDLNEFLKAPRESLNIELKSWIDPSTPEGKAKIVKAAIALRNFNGGYLGIGISNDGKPITNGVPEDLDDQFHQDRIQALIVRHSSESFEIAVNFGEINGARFPFIFIPPGVRTPVAAKLGIADPSDQTKELIKKHVVYVRTLESNHTPSSAAAQFSDWPQIMNICFDNREADIGNFVRRHLTGLDLPNLLAHFGGGPVEPETSVIDVFLNQCHQRFLEVKKSDEAVDLGRGRFEVAFIINSTQKTEKVRANEEFLSSFIHANPGLNGWPLWLNSRGFSERRNRPYIYSDGYEVLIEDYVGSFILPHLDFWRAEPPGRFYHYRVLWDDLVAIKNGTPPNKSLSMDITVRTVTEAISVALSFAKSMAFPVSDTSLDFIFRWSGLENRELSVHDFRRYISPGRFSVQDQITSYINIPLDIAPSSVPSIIPDVVADLFSSFDGMTFSNEVIEGVANELLDKKR